MYAESMNAIFMETSAKTAHNIINLFREICKCVCVKINIFLLEILTT